MTRIPEGLEEVMENFAELMQRLLEIQSGERDRSSKLVAEDKRLVERLRMRDRDTTENRNLLLAPRSIQNKTGSGVSLMPPALIRRESSLPLEAGISRKKTAPGDCW